MKGVLLIIDGLGDLPVEALGQRTPLEAASTPVMDRLASTGRFGLIDPISPGKTPSTYSGAGMLMGMSPEHAKRLQRGPVEAAGLCMDLPARSIALRANIATLETRGNGFIVTDRRAGRINDGVADLLASLEHVDLGDGISATLRPTHQHRAVLVLFGPGLDPAVSDTDPGDHEGPAALPDCVANTPSAALTATKINRFVRLAYERLRDHPVNRSRVAAGLPPGNGIITRGAGATVTVGNAVRDAGLRACVISGCNTVKGLGGLFGFDVISDARFTGDLQTDLNAKIASAISRLNDHEVVFVHIKAPDICAHDRQPLAKRDFLEKIDAALAPLTNESIVIAVAADHTTDSNTGFHTDDPVPALLHNPDNRRNGPQIVFGESACGQGNLPRQLSHQFVREMIAAIANS